MIIDLKQMFFKLFDLMALIHSNRLSTRIIKRKKLHRFRISEEVVKKHKKLWRQLSPNVNMNWLKYYISVSGIENEKYVPRDIYYGIIEPVMNNKRFLKAYADKNVYDLLYPDVIKPSVYLRCIDGFFYDGNYERLPEEIIKKNEAFINRPDLDDKKLVFKIASDSAKGRSIRIMRARDNKLYDASGDLIRLSQLGAKCGKNFLVQQYILQHPVIAKLNPDSLNSIRVYVYRSVRDDTIYPLHIQQKIGAPGMITDGSYKMAINHDGSYNSYCTHDKTGERLTSVNGIDIQSLGVFPFVNELKETAVRIANKSIHSRLLGLDLVINSSGETVFIEANNIHIGLHNIQLNNGPLFGEFTDEVIAFCKKTARSYSYYYNG